MEYRNKLLANLRALWPFYLFYAILILLVQNNSFFWDKDIIYSILANGILDKGASFIFENQVDMGYFPGLAYLLTVSWKIFGVTLPAMHWLMLPVSIGLAYEVFRFVKHFIPTKTAYLILIFVLIDPAILSQSVMYSTDLFQVYLFFAGLNAVLHNRRWLLSIALVCLVLVHGRGAITVATIYFSELIYRFIDGKLKEKWFRKIVQMSWAYLPSVLVVLIYLTVHYLKVGWIGYHDDSPWAGCFEVVDSHGILRNVIIVIWRILDFGRFIIFPLLLIGIYQLLKKKEKLADNTSLKILVPGLIFFAFSLPSMLIYRNLVAQRYMLIFFALIIIYYGYIVYSRIELSTKLKTLFATITVIVLVSGNFWVYPDHIAQDWSSTLGHLPFYKQRKEMLQFISENNIPCDEIGSITPNLRNMSILYLDDNDCLFNRKDLTTDKYIYYSNIINDFTDEEIAELKTEWKVVKEIKRFGIKTILYMKE